MPSKLERMIDENGRETVTSLIWRDEQLLNDAVVVIPRMEHVSARDRTMAVMDIKKVKMGRLISHREREASAKSQIPRPNPKRLLLPLVCGGPALGEPLRIRSTWRAGN